MILHCVLQVERNDCRYFLNDYLGSSVEDLLDRSKSGV